jgi:hypothetical protein
MVRCFALCGILALFVAVPSVRADTFDRYINSVLTKVPEAQGVKELKQLTPELISDNDQVLTGVTGAFLVIKTNEGRHSKLLVQLARQKIDADSSMPVLLIDRYVTYREGQEQTVYTKGQNVSLFDGFRFNLDIGQVVPPKLGGDLRFVAEGGKTYVEPLGKAKLYLVTQPLPEAAPKKVAKLVVGEVFEPRYFNGTYKLYDDGRRSGKLTLHVANDGEVSGAYYSDKDGQKYEVKGKVGTPKHAIQFSVKFPQSVQVFQGMLFTGDGKALTGTSRLQDRETGFYALRVEDE